MKTLNIISCGDYLSVISLPDFFFKAEAEGDILKWKSFITFSMHTCCPDNTFSILSALRQYQTGNFQDLPYISNSNYNLVLTNFTSILKIFKNHNFTYFFLIRKF